MDSDAHYMRLALTLARKGLGQTSPNPMVGAVLVRRGVILGRGWHRRAGMPHAEIEALHDAHRRGHNPRGASLYVTLEPCCTSGRTPPCVDAILRAGISTVVVGATDPNPRHSGRAFSILRRFGITLRSGVLGDECTELNHAFNHWIVHGTPFVTVKTAMTLDGKIATANGQSKWITGERARSQGMKLRRASDAILVGINTVLADDPALTLRLAKSASPSSKRACLRRVVLDGHAQLPRDARIITDEQSSLTTVFVGEGAPRSRVAKLSRLVRVVTAPLNHQSASTKPMLDLDWILKHLGADGITSLLVEGGGEINASFLLGGFAHRVSFFYAPKVLGGVDARRAVAGDGISAVEQAIELRDLIWRRVGTDLMLSAKVGLEH